VLAQSHEKRKKNRWMWTCAARLRRGNRHGSVIVAPRQDGPQGDGAALSDVLTGRPAALLYNSHGFRRRLETIRDVQG
jgi:hypothetical protein